MEKPIDAEKLPWLERLLIFWMLAGLAVAVIASVVRIFVTFDLSDVWTIGFFIPFVAVGLVRLPRLEAQYKAREGIPPRRHYEIY